MDGGVGELVMVVVVVCSVTGRSVCDRLPPSLPPIFAVR